MSLRVRKLARNIRLFASLVAVGLLGAVSSAVLLRADPSHLVPILFAELALIFLSALLIERSLLAEFNEKANARAEQMTRHISQGIQDYFRKEFATLKYANEYGLALLPPRRSLTKNPGATYEEIALSISRAKRVCMFCTSGIDVFPPTSSPSEVFTALRNRAQDTTRQFSLTVLTCQPDGEYARVRGVLENALRPDYIKRDVETSLDTFEQLLETCKGSPFPADWYFYDFVPQMWFLLTDAEVYMETYHFGLHRRAPNDATSCIGGRVPMVHAQAGSGLWMALNEYVDFLTLPNDVPELEGLRLGYFRVQQRACAA